MCSFGRVPLRWAMARVGSVCHESRGEPETVHFCCDGVDLRFELVELMHADGVRELECVEAGVSRERDVV